MFSSLDQYRPQPSNLAYVAWSRHTWRQYTQSFPEAHSSRLLVKHNNDQFLWAPLHIDHTHLGQPLVARKARPRERLARKDISSCYSFGIPYPFSRVRSHWSMPAETIPGDRRTGVKCELPCPIRLSRSDLAALGRMSGALGVGSTPATTIERLGASALDAGRIWRSISRTERRWRSCVAGLVPRPDRRTCLFLRP